jgi:type II secretory pathway component GspD/PulD (secretin)
LCNVIAGLFVGVAPPALAWAGDGTAGSDRQLAQLWGRASKAHAALNAAIESQQRGDFEAAAAALQEAQSRQDDLSPQEREELARLRQANAQALQARRDGAELLRRAEQALRSGRASEAAEYVKRAAATEQYLAAADKLRYTQLSAQLRLGTSRPQPAAGAISPTEARAKLFQARAQLADGHWEVAENLAHQVQRSGATFSPTEDSPARLLEDLGKMRRDPKALIQASRAALAHKEFDRAEVYAHQAEQYAGWSLPWSDSPARVQREIQSARASAGSANPSLSLAAAGRADASPVTTPAANNAPAPLPAPLGYPVVPSVGSSAVQVGGTAAPADPHAAAVRQAATPPGTASPDTEKARALLRQGRQALAQGDFATARRCAEQARILRADLHWSDDTPERLLNDVARTEARRQVPAVQSATATAAAPTGGPAQTKEEAAALVQEGRVHLREGMLDDATRCAQRARALTSVRWGLFEDNPSALIADIEKQRARHNREESVRVLAEARRLYEQGDYDAADRAAYRAESLHGPYSIWELGDRPSKLHADVQGAREKNIKPKLPPAPPTVAQAPRGGPAATNPPTAEAATGATTDPAAEARARQMLAEGRYALQNGDPARARALADQVRAMHVTLGRPGDDSPEAIYIAIAQQTGGPLPQAGAPLAGGPPPASGPAAERQSAHQRAVYLMAEARQCAREDRLLDARQKVIEAQRLEALFAPGEEMPEMLYQQIALRARQRMDALVNRATETARFGGGDVTVRLQKAEQDLQQARQLAVGFGQDPSGVDRLLVVVRQQCAMASAATPPAPAATPPAPGPGGSPVVRKDVPAGAAPAPQAAPAARKLEMARLELQHGDTALARRLAEEAARDPQSPCRDEALAVIRTVDTEEYNQKRLRVMRTFDAAWSAYLRRDYVNSGNMIAAIDTALLDETRQDKLRDMMATPEMQPANRGQVVQAGGPGAAARPTTLPPGAGQAHATDDPDSALLRRTQAMRQILFDKLRKEGLEKQTEALDKFRTGQQEAAMDLLRDYLTGLDGKQLDAHQMALLRRPVEARLKQLQLLHEQEQFANRTADKHRLAKDSIEKVQLAEQQKQKNVAELMKQFNALYHEGKYEDATALAMRAHDLDPDNPVVTAAVGIAQTQSNKKKFDDIKGRRESTTLNALDAAEDEGQPSVITRDIAIDKEAAEKAAKRTGASAVPMPRHNDKEREIERMLSTPVTLNFTNAPLKTVIDDLRAFKGINIWVNEAALAEEGISTDRPVTVKLDQIALRSALTLLLQNMHLTYVIRDEVLQITTRKDAQGKLNPVTYQVADLVIPVDDFATLTPASAITNMPPATPPGGQPTPSPITGPMSLSGGTGVGTPTGYSSSQPSGSPFATDTSAANSGNWNKKVTKTNEEVLIKLIMNTVEPQSWSEMGGPGTIDYFPNTMALVINQTPDIQEQVAELLEALRRLQDQEVAIEVRFISVAEDFYERIGVNFHVNFLTHPKSDFQQQLTTGTFQPDALINQFTPNHFISGVQPNLAFTPDLNVPLNVDTFTQTIPPFGGYPGIPGAGGITTGIAFLSDIQVFLFMEAAQGDTRTNVMSAPKLTLFNGQTANINITDTQPFVSQVSVTPQQGIFTFTPIVAQYVSGQNIALTVQAVISADRRFVRMSLVPTIAQPSSPIVTLFPIVVPIFPNFDNTGTGQPVVFTQFIQQPRINSVNVQTTVAVPDGGTVLMGGFKRLFEGRVEAGPPILSKIPYIDRLFKNVGYGKETESLLIMVTPRIIIQEEEEERQTGYVRPRTVIP